MITGDGGLIICQLNHESCFNSLLAYFSFSIVLNKSINSWLSSPNSSDSPESAAEINSEISEPAIRRDLDV
jgi:hypothetical protein